MRKAPSILFALFILCGVIRFLLWIPDALGIYDTVQPDWVGFVSAILLIIAAVSMLLQRDSVSGATGIPRNVQPGDYLLLGLVILFALAGVFVSADASLGEPQASIMKAMLILFAVGTVIASFSAFIRSMVP